MTERNLKRKESDENRPTASCCSPHEAIKFALSPKQVRREDIPFLREMDPNLCLRIASTIDLKSVIGQDISCDPGFSLALWPRQTGQTNMEFERLQTFRDEAILYDRLLNSTSTISMADVIAFVLRFLDHFLKSMAVNSSDFASKFVGPYAKKPFQKTEGDSISYLTLLKFTSYLVEGHPDLESCRNLLDSVEQHLQDTLELNGVRILNTNFKQQVRKEILEYYELEENYGAIISKDTRNLAAHPFTVLLFTEYKKSLKDQDALQNLFPRTSNLFREDVLARLVIVLLDLQRKFERGEYASQFETVLPSGFFLIKLFIKINNANERAVVWNSYQASIPGREGSIEPPLALTGRRCECPLVFPAV